MTARQQSLGLFARAGFQDLSAARETLTGLSNRLSFAPETLIEAFSFAADPDLGLHRCEAFSREHEELCASWDAELWFRCAVLFGASPALGDFFLRHPHSLTGILRSGGRLIDQQEALASFFEAICINPNSVVDHSTLTVPAAVSALRVRYREVLAEVMLSDLLWGISAPDTQKTATFDGVASSLSDLAGAALEAGLAIARTALLTGVSGPPVAVERIAQVRLAVIAMGKCGANELNVVSDVDVLFVADTSDPAELDTETLIRLSTRLATEMMRALQDHAEEPPLWQVDPNLRPEGRQGALVRTLGSMLTYYERWAKAWEFQALLKARAIAGDTELGEAFVAATRPHVWASGAREDFVGSVQRMRERVTEHIAEEDIEYQLKLGPGGLRDIEFSVQLLQLVHGQFDESLHLRGTLPALDALVTGGYIARTDAERLAADYRILRQLEHRLQLRDLRRTALMPRDHEGERILARSSNLAKTGEQLIALWHRVKQEVRSLHLKIFYAPLLSAVSVLPEAELALSGDQARSRLQSIGFRDPDGALRHLAALTRGTSRAAKIQRNLLPVMLQWLAEGTDPDFGLVSFRRISEAHHATPWYLRLLRDGSEAAERLAKVLSTSKFTTELLESFPEAVAWLERDVLLRPIAQPILNEEIHSLVSRQTTMNNSAEKIRAVHRREVLRLALGRIVFVNSDADVSVGLDAAHTALLEGLLYALHTHESQISLLPQMQDSFRISLIGMGRYGGRELGFASDIDVIAVLRLHPDLPSDLHSSTMRAAEKQISELRRHVSDPRFSVDLDFDLRPEGKNGALVRTLESYEAYYQRWSVTWESQALLRARAVAGDVELGAQFIQSVRSIRYPDIFSPESIREVRRIKARVESERLPRGADPQRHLKLGPGGISDVEWLVQLLQLCHASQHPELQTVSTLTALEAAKELGLLSPEDTQQLQSSWLLASQIRSAIKLWTGKSQDSLPRDRNELAGITGIMGMPHGSTGELEELWFGNARRTRAIVERVFFGYQDDPILGAPPSSL